MVTSSPFTYTPTGADWLRILPELALLAAVFVTLLADLGARAGRKGVLAIVGLFGTIASGATLVYVSSLPSADAFDGMVTSDGVALFSGGIVLVALFLALLLAPSYLKRQRINREGEFYALLQLAALGMLLMASANNLMMIFVGLETLSLSLYVLCAMPQTRLRAQESGMKYFILSSFSSAFLLYGMSLVYGATGATAIPEIATFLSRHTASFGQGYGPLLTIGMALMAVGFGFKVSAIPFQAWTPDVYTGAPTPVTAFMSVGTKVAAFAALARVFLVALHSETAHWQPVIWAIAALTMIGGNLLAVTQRDVKRMLAYSSIANAGYLLVAVATGSQRALASLLFYLAAYAVMNIGAFGVTMLVERDDGRGTALDDFNGLARRNPVVAGAMAVFLFSLAGMPPTAGFLAKYFVFYAAIVDQQTLLAVIGILSSVLGMYYYLRVIWAMYFVEPESQAEHTLQPIPEPVLVASGAPSSAATSNGTLVNREAVPLRVGSLLPVGAGASPVAVPFSAALSLLIAVALTLGLAVIASPLDSWAQTAAAALLR